jgi:excisionase family DNA binding protein
MTDKKELRRPTSYSTAYVAERLGVSVPTVQRWVDAGHLKAWKTLGGHRRIDAQSAERLFESQHLPEAGTAKAPPSVVIVEDNPDDRDLLAALCEEAFPGARLTLAENGFVGLVAVGQAAPDVLIADIVMPKMDGIEMLRQLSQHCAVRPRVLVAASSEPAELRFRRGRLPDDVLFVAKPIEPEPFIELLRTSLALAGKT